MVISVGVFDLFLINVFVFVLFLINFDFFGSFSGGNRAKKA